MASEVEGPLARFYTVDYSVGSGGLNHAEDVMLVQFFLYRIYGHPFSDYQRPTGDEMAIDGSCGPITRKWILGFQRDAAARDGLAVGAIKTDGRVDPVPHGNGPFNTRTISMLNYVHAEYYPFDSDARSCDEAPPRLRAALGKSVLTTGGGV